MYSYKKVMALQKSPTSGVAAIFQNLDIPVYVFALEKSLRLGDRIFYLAITLGFSSFLHPRCQNWHGRSARHRCLQEHQSFSSVIQLDFLKPGSDSVES